MQKRKLKWWQEALVVLLIVLPLMLFVLWPVFNLDTKPWERGREIPATPPAEGRRIHGTLGFSIVVPPNWESRELASLQMLVLHPRQALPRRHRAGIHIRRRNAEERRGVNEITNADDVVATELAGYDARLATVRRAGTFDDPPLTNWTFRVAAEDEVYELSYYLADDPVDLPPMVRRYLNTFRIETDEHASDP